MSFDIFYQNGPAERCSVEELNRRIIAALARSGATLSEDGWTVETSSGSSFEWSGPTVRKDGQSKKSAAALLRGLDPSVARCLFDIAQDTGWFILPAMEDVRTIRIAGRKDPLPDPDMPELLDVSSAEELFHFLDSGFEGWQVYRERVVGR